MRPAFPRYRGHRPGLGLGLTMITMSLVGPELRLERRLGLRLGLGRDWGLGWRLRAMQTPATSHLN